MTQSSRTIRVFISSTFSDMYAEREELMKQIFPQLRKLCESRGLTWTDVDLRWGISNEQKAQGQALPICLKQVDQCRPFFISILGDHYGSVPRDISQDILKLYPWLEDCRDRSVTEIEILHGALNDPIMAKGAFFYIRRPESERLESPINVNEHRKLQSLKHRIRSSGLPLRENYQTPQELGKWVLEDFVQLIDKLYPEEQKPSPLDHEASQHEAFADSRTQVYVARKEYYERLDEHADGDGPPLVLLGDAGSGKSALLANWVSRRQNAHPEQFFLKYFIGTSSSSTDWRIMLRYIMGELKRYFDIQNDIPTEPEKLRAAFANFLNMTAAKARLVIIIDGLNQLEKREAALDLLWLPPEVPDNVRLIVSTLPGRPLEVLQERLYPTFRVEQLEVHERKRLIMDYLARYSKALDPKRVDQLSKAEQCANPLFLCTLLEELRLFGEHDQLGERIGRCLLNKTVPDLYETVLDRYESDYERDHPGLVRETMSLLWAARRGLSEEELLDLLGTEKPLPQAHWSPFFLAAAHLFVSRSGLLGFVHDYLSQAVKRKYLMREEKPQCVHLRLADYFESKDVCHRKVEELPWHLKRTGSWVRLFNLLSDLDFLDAAYHSDSSETKALWEEVEANNGGSKAQAYGHLLEQPSKYTQSSVWAVTSIIEDTTGVPSELLRLWQYIVKNCRETNDTANLPLALANLARTAFTAGDYGRAIDTLRQEEQICRDLNDMDALAGCLDYQGIIYNEMGDVERALILHKESEEICRNIEAYGRLAQCLGHQGSIIGNRGDVKRALSLFDEGERIARKLGDQDLLATALANRGSSLFKLDDLEAALRYTKAAEQTFRRIGDRRSRIVCIQNMASLLIKSKKLKQAVTMIEDADVIARQMCDPESLQRSISLRANVALSQGDKQQALSYIEEAEHLNRQSENRVELARTLLFKADILAQKRDTAAAFRSYAESEQLFKEIGYSDNLATCLANQALLMQDVGATTEALNMLKKAQNVFDSLVRHSEAEACRRNRLAILGKQGSKLFLERDYAQSLDFFDKAEDIAYELSDLRAIASCVEFKVTICLRQGELYRVLESLERLEQFCRQTNSNEELGVCLARQIEVLLQQGETKKANSIGNELRGMYGNLELSTQTRDRISMALTSLVNLE